MKLSKIDCYQVITALRVMENEMQLGYLGYDIWVRLATFLDFPEDVIEGIESKRLQARTDEIFELL